MENGIFTDICDFLTKYRSNINYIHKKNLKKKTYYDVKLRFLEDESPQFYEYC